MLPCLILLHLLFKFKLLSSLANRTQFIKPPLNMKRNTSMRIYLRYTYFRLGVGCVVACYEISEHLSIREISWTHIDIGAWISNFTYMTRGGGGVITNTSTTFDGGLDRPPSMVGTVITSHILWRIWKLSDALTPLNLFSSVIQE